MSGLNRRRLLQRAGIGALALAWPGPNPRLAWSQQRPPLVPGLPAGVYDTAVLDALPGKEPLIKLSYRPPNYETPVSYFKTAITPNDAFFVRYHLADIPEEIDPKTWGLRVGGEAAATPFQLTLPALQTRFEQVEITAVCQCPGNRRGWSQPHVPGVDGEQVRVGQPLEITGVAWDAGYGIRRIEVSVNNGNIWQAANLGPDLGRFAFRTWTYRFTPQAPGKHTISAKASNVIGQTQAESLIFNPAGYHNNVVRPLTITAA
jgi:hypothetical protein